jgi:myosin heavy subunit
MSYSDFGKLNSSRTPFHTGVLVILLLGVAVALAGNLYQFVKAEHMARDTALMQRNLQAQINRLSDATSGAFEVTQQRFEGVKKIEDTAAEAIQSARSEVKRTNSQMADRLEKRNRQLEQKNKELVGQLAELKQDTSAKLQSTSAGLQNTSAKLESASAKLDQLSAETEKNGAELKRVVGDLGVMSGSVATNARQLAALREIGDRNYFEFDVIKTKVPTGIAEIQIALKKTDPKKNRYTIDLYTNDKVVHKGDRSINEPLQLYVGTGRQPYEVVVNQVRKDEVIGYVAVPKGIIPTTQAASATRSGGAASQKPRQ